MKPPILLAIAVLLTLSGCGTLARHRAERQYCAQATTQGLCSPSCGRRQPPECRVTYKLIPPAPSNQSRFMCMYEGSDGSLAFGTCPPAP